MHRKPVDRLFLVFFLALLCAGLVIFISAALGELVRSRDKFENVIISQLVFGLLGGSVAFFAALRIPMKFWKQHAFWILVTALLFSLLVFVPGIGMEHGGAKRWIDFRLFNVQPAEFLKFALVLYLAAWFTQFHRKVHSSVWGLYPLLAVLGIVGTILLAQPDTGTFLIGVAAGMAIFLVAGGKWTHFLMMILAGIILLAGMAFSKPYIMDRITTLINPSEDPHGSGYQIKQSLIAIGSGGLTGRGFGQSVQKFNYLPEPIGDSVFAVAGEELGFIGTVTLIFLYLLFGLRGLWVAAHAEDRFSGLFAVGLVILIISQSFVNIGSMLALGPLTGVPLVFVSHGGTALLVAMAQVGIILNISRNRKNT
jgi:cell division protein FtsW